VSTLFPKGEYLVRSLEFGAIKFWVGGSRFKTTHSLPAVGRRTKYYELIMSQGNSSIFSLGWGVLISLVPLPQSVVFFPG